MVLNLVWPLLAAATAVAIFSIKFNLHTNAQSLESRRCFPPILYDTTNLTVFRDGLDKSRAVPPDIVAVHPGFYLPASSTPMVKDFEPRLTETDFFLRRAKRRALDLKTKDTKANERPTCRKNAGAYGQLEERQPTTGEGGIKTPQKLSSTQVNDGAFDCHSNLPKLHIQKDCSSTIASGKGLGLGFGQGKTG
jgi:hypothetical protein